MNCFSKVTPDDLYELQRICTPERVFSGEAISEDYSHDEMPLYGRHMPEVAVEALSDTEVCRIMEFAYRRNIPVTPRGAGTGLCGGAVALFGGILLSTARMNRILEIDEENFTATVEPGVLLMDLSAAAASVGLFYPPDPGEKSATIGGNIMTNAGGMRAVKYGVTRDYVLGFDVVLPDGELLVLGGKVAKSSSGYSLKNLIIGSEGTLGIVTRIILRLIPEPQKSISLLVPFDDLDECIKTVPEIIRSKYAPTAVEFMQREVIEAAEKYLGKKFPDSSSEAYLLLSFDGSTQTYLEEAIEGVAGICLDNNARDVLISDTKERQDKIWNIRGAFLEAIKSSTPEMDECDVVVPRNKVALFVKYVNGLGKQYGVRMPYFGHAGDGNLHIYVCRDALPQEQWTSSLASIMDSLYEEAQKLGGQVSGEHGIGHAKMKFLRSSAGETFMELSAGIKSVFDPKGILNPGKVCRYSDLK